MADARCARVERNTKETQITVEVNLDGEGIYQVSTGIGFLDHMIEQLTPDRPDPALSDPVLPRASICGSNWIDAEVLDRVGDPR